MVDGLTIREATQLDADRIRALLAQMHLGTDNVLASGTRYWVADDGDGETIGTVGVECGVDAVLLRSTAVDPRSRSRGVGAALVRAALLSAAADGCKRVYLFSTGAGPYWANLGFETVPVPELVAELPNAPQVRRYEELGWLPTEVAWRLELPDA